MRNPSSSKVLSFLAVLAALVIPGLLPQSAHGMYDPKHGRWLQRDPVGVSHTLPLGMLSGTSLSGHPSSGRSTIRPRQQYQDGMGLYEYVKSRPGQSGDPRGLCLSCLEGMLLACTCEAALDPRMRVPQEVLEWKDLTCPLCLELDCCIAGLRKAGSKGRIKCINAFRGSTKYSPMDDTIYVARADRNGAEAPKASFHQILCHEATHAWVDQIWLKTQLPEHLPAIIGNLPLYSEYVSYYYNNLPVSTTHPAGGQEDCRLAAEWAARNVWRNYRDILEGQGYTEDKFVREAIQQLLEDIGCPPKVVPPFSASCSKDDKPWGRWL